MSAAVERKLAAILSRRRRLLAADGGGRGRHRPPGLTAAAWRQAYEEHGYAAIVRAALEHEVAASGTACTNDVAQAASMLALLGEADRMLVCLDEALRRKHATIDLKSSPAYDPYRSDPRFIAVLERMHLAD